MTSNIFIVAKNEFLKRVKTKWFILTTLLGPMALIAFIAIVGYVSISSLTSEEQTVAVIDATGILFDGLHDEDGQITFVVPNLPEDSVRQAVIRGVFDGYLLLDAEIIAGNGKATYFSKGGGGASFFSRKLRNLIRSTIEERRLLEQQVPPEVFEILNARVDINMVQLSETGETTGGTEAYAAVGFIMGFLIYIAMVTYGSVVMQGVMQEKVNRVVEIIVSSVRPFDLLMGKVLGIGAMGLVQMAFWAILIMAGVLLSGTILATFLDPATLNLPASASQDDLLAAADFTIPAIELSVFIWFVAFFLVGYLLYASLFSAIGSTVEQQQDAQSLMLPVMLPVILSLVFLQSVIEAPNSTLAVVLSMFPLTSPVSMVVRFAVTDVAFWEVSISFLILLGSFVGSIWIASKIYRVGILMYGKKASFGDLIRWARLS
ncbi:MAG: ABC transporter permease [Rhodothermia bacterium]|nr:MAG: ABC transporter permease [Rhodothermia bacterium]